VKRWYDLLKQREGLRRGMALGRDRINRNPQDDAQARKTLFGLED
jgi:GST-like protein